MPAAKLVRAGNFGRAVRAGALTGLDRKLAFARREVEGQFLIVPLSPTGRLVTMERLLVVANRTAGSPELLGALRERASREPIAITLLVPATWDLADPHGGRETAVRNLDAALRQLRAAGLQVEGVVGDPDPLVAVRDIWDPARFDEVVVSTLPSAISRWLELDLPRRVGRFTQRPVTHVGASEALAPPINS